MEKFRKLNTFVLSKLLLVTIIISLNIILSIYSHIPIHSFGLSVNDDYTQTTMNIQLNIDVITNDTADSGVTITSVDSPTYLGGSVSLNPNNTISYTPPTNRTGEDIFVYSATGDGQNRSALVYVTINPGGELICNPNPNGTNAEAETGLCLVIEQGEKKVYSGDNIDNNDLCINPESNSRLVRSIQDDGNPLDVNCSPAESAINLPALKVKPFPQQPKTSVYDIVLSDESGSSPNNFTSSLTVTVDDFVSNNGSRIDLGANPTNQAFGLDKGVVSHVEVTNNTTNTTNGQYNLVFSGGGATTSAQGYCVVANSEVTQVVITNPGVGYTTEPSVICNSVSLATFQAQIVRELDNRSSGIVTDINITNGGSGYSDGQFELIVQNVSTPFPPRAIATITSGVVTSVQLINQGNFMNNAPVFTVPSWLNGSGATFNIDFIPSGQAIESNFVMIDPSLANLKRILPNQVASPASFFLGARGRIVNKYTAQTILSSSNALAGRYDLDDVEFSLRIPAFVTEGIYTSIMTQTLTN